METDMAFPRYGETPMDIKRPTGDFGNINDIQIQRTKDHAYVTFEGNKYKVFVEAIMDVDIESIIDSEHEINEDDFKIKGYAFDWRSIVKFDDSNIDDKTKQRIVDILTHHYQAKGYQVQIDNKG